MAGMGGTGGTSSDMGGMGDRLPAPPATGARWSSPLMNETAGMIDDEAYRIDRRLRTLSSACESGTGFLEGRDGGSWTSPLFP